MPPVEVRIAATLYFSFCGFLVFPLFGAPPLFSKMAIALCGYEFTTATLWAASRDTCLASGCSRFVASLSSLAGVEIPALTAVLFVVAAGYALFVARNW
jgi:hypothetical protein